MQEGPIERVPEASSASGRGWVRATDQFVLSLLANVVIPFIPVVIELIAWGTVRTDTLTITACLYPVAVGISVVRSQFQSIMMLSYVSAIVFGIMYGFVVSGYDTAVLARTLSFWAIAAFTMVYVGDRVYRHLLVGEPFLTLG